MELAEGALPPGEDVVAIDGLLDADGRGRWDGPVLDAVRRFGLQEVAQLSDCGTCLGELELETVEVLDDQPVARVGVRRGEDAI